MAQSGSSLPHCYEVLGSIPAWGSCGRWRRVPHSAQSAPTPKKVGLTKGPFYVEFACSPSVTLGMYHIPPQKYATGESKKGLQKRGYKVFRKKDQLFPIHSKLKRRKVQWSLTITTVVSEFESIMVHRVQGREDGPAGWEGDVGYCM